MARPASPSPVASARGAALLAAAVALACPPKPSPSTLRKPIVPAASRAPEPPVAEKRPHEIWSPHGTRVDEYYWLRDDARADPAVIAHLEAENAYKDAMLAPVTELRETLYRELVDRIPPEDAAPPHKDRGYWYYWRYEARREYPIHARRHGSLDSPEQVLLDESELAKGHEFFDLGTYTISPDGQLLAWAEDTVGRRQYTVRFLDLRTGKVLPDAIPGADESLAWADDNETLFYIEKDPVTLLGVRVKRHRLGRPLAEDETAYEETDHAFYISLGRTGDHRFVVIHLSSTVSDELRFLPAGSPRGELRVLAPRRRDFEYDADHVGGRWIVRTNWDAPNFRLMAVPDREVGDRARWSELLPHRPDVYIAGFELFEDHLVVAERSDGLPRIRIRDWKGRRDAYVAADEPAYSTWIDVNAEQNTPWLRYGYTSLVTPRTIYEVHMETGERRLLKQDVIPGGFRRGDYATKRVWAVARDGTKVPVSLAFRKGLARDGQAPLYQYGYGAYGASMDAAFRPHVISLLDRGFLYALAHVRGGQEMGRAWYESGKLLRKRNTFTDFIDVTEHLVREGWAAKDRVAISGGSAGGLLIGAVVNLRPDLYRAAVADVPFVDVVTTMLDESIPLTTNEYDEWGDPRQKSDYEYMLSYSPYDNVAPQDYPALLVTTGLWDSQVQYFEPAKWVARLRDRKTGTRPVLFHVEMEAGHGGPSGRFRSQRERALEYAFVLRELGMASDTG